MRRSICRFLLRSTSQLFNVFHLLFELWPRRGSSRVLCVTKGSRKDCPSHTVGSQFEVSRTQVLRECSGQRSMHPIAACASPLNLKLKIESNMPVKRLCERSSQHWRIAFQAAAPSPPPEPCTLSKASDNQQNKHTVASTAEDGTLS